uniref:peptidylprolyl isomerase n=1 Tax=Haptolina brevifila TaxID=156173 RepID=A0A7S2DPD4_9EUKA|eukprot:CAMPEP_0174720882 /NCGR_PEP_ID=MMETSP1094-20130205/34764_1 /TAXON_ID=156173 /ORGANISM="Chrysochromulina brevifilum, Strain UTEX LB 985" /LENGTH=115 /DNA_ID=CAMNT_0015921459 /DNA_START=45 /DNA_END=392 /DNA_ORIENTATION=+
MPLANTVNGFATTYEIVKEGSGPGIEAGQKATVHARGEISGKKFWDTKDPGQQPFSYDAGVGSVITGWDQGCLGMKIGEIRKLEIPGHEGYKKEGFPAWGITPNATLNFTLERLK